MSLSLLREALASSDKHFSPFLILGDPIPDLSVQLAIECVRAGATMLELGFPFSDPIADGPSIQAAVERARKADVSTECALEILTRIRAAVDVPLNLLVYGNLVHARGALRFIQDVERAGASSLLVPDVPHEENESLARACGEGDLGFVELIGPHTAIDRAQRIARRATGFVYLAGHQGTTGARDQVSPGLMETTASTGRSIDSPLCVGFGLKTPEHIRSVFESGAKIAVVGSALAERIGRQPKEHELLRDVSRWVHEMSEPAKGCHGEPAC